MLWEYKALQESDITELVYTHTYTRSIHKVKKQKKSGSVSCSVVSDSLQSHELYIACKAPMSMEFPRQEYWSRLRFPSPGNLPNPGIEFGSLALKADSLSFDPAGKPQEHRGGII